MGNMNKVSEENSHNGRGLAARARRACARITADWWLVLALLALLLFGTARVPWLAAQRETAMVLLGFALLVAPIALREIALRAARFSQKSLANRAMQLAVVLHPSRAYRALRDELALTLALREGRALTEPERARLTREDPHRAWIHQMIALIEQGAMGALLDALRDPADRERFYEAGLGLAHLRAIALHAPSPEAIVRAYSELRAFDPRANESDQRARFAAFTLAYAGDRDAALRAADELGAYFTDADSAAIRAMAHLCAGDRESAQRALDHAMKAHPRNALVQRALANLSRVVQTAPLRDKALFTEELAHLVAQLHEELRECATLAPLDGKTAIPWLTIAWSLALVIAFVLESVGGSVYDPRHLAQHGGLATVEYPSLGALRARWWPLFTHGLLHAGALHLALNVATLASFGSFCEAIYGRWRAATIYLCAAAVTGCAVIALTPANAPTVLVGASGSIFALGSALAAALAFDPALRATRRGRWQLIVLVVGFAMQSVIDRMIPGISATAHLWGLGTGLVMGAGFTARRRSRRPFESR